MLTITLPLPNADLNPNRAHGRHWGATRKLKDEAKRTAYYLTKALKIGPVKGALFPLALTFAMEGYRKRDADNLLASAKSALDGVAEALEINDHSFEPVTIKRVYGAEKSMLLLEIGP
ncbi:hypothetical protein [Ferrovum sp.]|uniref:hypothetical protein n=1 Tax=Ferrovum sp. TaxID=2609467 RepID=UPI002629CC89|nr:hypothetical protein [Ferrovum sp.]